MKTKMILITLFVMTISVFPICGQKFTNDIDRLCNQYKDEGVIVIHSMFGNVEAKISIDKNQNDKPQSITLSGRTSDIDAISEIAYNLINQKKAQGFVYYSGDKITDGIIDWDAGKEVFGLEYIKSKLRYLKYVNNNLVSGVQVAQFEAFYKKGNLYFHIRIIRNKYTQSNDFLSSLQSSFDHCDFDFENGDNNRKGGINSTKFEF